MRCESGNQIDDDGEGEPDVGESEPTEEELVGVVLRGERRGMSSASMRVRVERERGWTHDSLDVEEEEPEDVVTGSVETEEVDERVLYREKEEESQLEFRSNRNWAR